LKQPLQKAALWRGRAMTALVLHLVQFIAQIAFSYQRQLSEKPSLMADADCYPPEITGRISI